MTRSSRCCLPAVLLVFGALTMAAQARAEIAFSRTGAHLALSAPSNNGVEVLDIDTGVLTTLTDTPSSGYAFAWSPDGTKLGFKVLHAAGDGYLQEPVVYDVTSGTLQSLAAPSPLAGVPSFSAHGDVAFTLGQDAVVVDSKGIASRYDLGQYVNLLALSPDGTRLAYNGSDDAIWVLELATGSRGLVVSDPSFAPSWSPNGKRLLVQGINGTVACADLERAVVVALGRGTSPSWLPDGENVIFTALDVPLGDGRTPVAVVETIRFDGTQRRQVAGAKGYDVRVAPGGKTLVYRPDVGEAPMVARSKTTFGAASSRTPLMDGVRSRRQVSVPHVRDLPPSGWRLAPVKIPDVPYLHQVYDTPNDFNGHWACNATAAVMTLAYYGVIDPWDTTVNVPTSHVSHFGNYVSKVYTVNGHTLDVGSADPNGKIAYGGYGYIVQDNWSDTKGRMAKYIEFHGPQSAVDWSPSWAKVIGEIDAGHPFVVLTSITSSGHYIVDIGYHSDQHTAIFNDPYGNKNDGYMNYKGAGVNYDWPGYNNGFSNLTTVHCFIWSRATVEPESPPDAGTPEVDSGPLPDEDAATEESPAPDAAMQDDAAEFDVEDPEDVATADAKETSGNYIHEAEEADGCACTAAGGRRGHGAATWGLLWLLLIGGSRRRRPTGT